MNLPNNVDTTRITDILAIDGPAGAGKSTVARRAAEALDFAFLDTGAMYRAATWNAMEQGIDLDDGAAIARATREMDLDMRDTPAGARVYVNGRDVSDSIRTPEVTRNISKLDHNPDVRAHLVELQRAIGARTRTVAEGRDMGTVVFPNAKCKIYLDASLGERARRRALEYESKGVVFDAAELESEIRARDKKDMTRAIAPLRRAEDAVLIDTSGKSVEEVLAEILTLARTRWPM